MSNSYKIYAIDSLSNVVEIAGEEFACPARAISAARGCCHLFAADRRINEIVVWKVGGEDTGPIDSLDMWQWRLESDEFNFMLH